MRRVEIYIILLLCAIENQQFSIYLFCWHFQDGMMDIKVLLHSLLYTLPFNVAEDFQMNSGSFAIPSAAWMPISYISQSKVPIKDHVLLPFEKV